MAAEEASVLRIGIMGGTFDPIHFGHLLAAQEALVRLSLQQVIFVPTGNSYQKTYRSVTPAEERYMMTFLATLDNPKFSVSRLEIDREDPSHTVDTLREMRYWYADQAVEFFFITGIDALMSMDTWTEYEKIPELCTIVAANRPGYDYEHYNLDNLPEKVRSRVLRLEIPLLSISSTEIRHRVAAGENLRYLLPHPVEQYIYKRGLYKDEDPGRDVVLKK
ncbi:nicotinate-nucleotide adenylyltransferase [Pyramidobacter sp.]|uniref:nicotinate-nucleotide adenylyltransferase n=1 Tax=Pyramidobacter sp. TaxID=1943581 RepID=UPI0025FA0E90|nr:nicotinate-nucleotide adenylyltransferase [Pyramidobacter sp.]MCI7404659.1 nicotinate-nucleotide adenylyltransferase [Pyramidobacter sp.]MDY3212164.1 nicotinate-nucleotide adenylyltransferase [Pyramidobacter sp.]